MKMHGPLCRALAVLAIGLSVALLGVDAGKNWQGHGPRDKSLQKPREGRRTSFNHVPAPLKKEHELPKNWNWVRAYVSWKHTELRAGDCGAGPAKSGR